MAAISTTILCQAPAMAHSVGGYGIQSASEGEFIKWLDNASPRDRIIFARGDANMSLVPKHSVPGKVRELTRKAYDDGLITLAMARSDCGVMMDYYAIRLARVAVIPCHYKFSRASFRPTE